MSRHQNRRDAQPPPPIHDAATMPAHHRALPSPTPSSSAIAVVPSHASRLHQARHLASPASESPARRISLSGDALVLHLSPAHMGLVAATKEKKEKLKQKN